MEKNLQNKEKNTLFLPSISPSLRPMKINDACNIFSSFIKNEGKTKKSPNNSNSSINTIISNTSINSDLLDMELQLSLHLDDSSIANVCNDSKITTDLKKNKENKNKIEKLEKQFY